jgi:site-specific recombinase XerD
MVRRRVAVGSLDERVVDSFCRRRPEKVRLRNAAALLLAHLRAEGVVAPYDPPPDSSPTALLCDRYRTYLRKERALAESTVRSRLAIVTDFLKERFADGQIRTSSLSAQDATDFLLRRVRTGSPRRGQYIGTALRSFFRFLFSRGETERDLATAVLTSRAQRLVGVPRYISAEDVERVLAACDRSTPAGRRDYAVLLLLARLGLRAGEVVALSLDDLHWRRGELTVRGKGLLIDRLPLLPDVGEALAAYVSRDRRAGAIRRVFLRMMAPYRGFANSAAITSIAKRSIEKAGLRPGMRGAYVFRHSLATHMIRQGASMAEIGGVLRHRSPNTTAIYAKVDFEGLRALALTWPGTGGGR